MRELTFRDALNEALDEELARDPEDRKSVV